jgi:hypothetical protein
MKNKVYRMLLIAVCLMVTAAVAACSTPGTGPAPAAPSFPESTPAANSSPAQEPAEEGDAMMEGEYKIFTARDEHVAIEVFVRSEPYSVGDFVHLYMQVANIGDVPLAYVHGSGSNTVPEALEIDLGGLFGVYRPAIMTRDFQTRMLNPGDILEFDIAFAPYTANAESALPPPPGTGLEFFADNENFSPALPGLFTGKVAFSYTVADEESEEDSQEEVGPFFLVQEGESQTLRVEIDVILE